MFSTVCFVTFFVISYSFETVNIQSQDMEVLTLKETKNIFRNMNPHNFNGNILCRLIQNRTSIKINKTLSIQFYQTRQIAHAFPLFLSNVTMGTKGKINNSSIKLSKVEIALDRVRKLIRHPRVLHEISGRNFSLFGKKKYIEGRTLIKMFGSKYLTNGFFIYIKSLKQGKI